jgi:hypothetical protein
MDTPQPSFPIAGMELRDYFAAVALPNYIARFRPKEAVQLAYELADEMLRARQNPPSDNVPKRLKDAQN